jgi:hypothetical protein
MPPGVPAGQHTLAPKASGISRTIAFGFVSQTSRSPFSLELGNYWEFSNRAQARRRNTSAVRSILYLASDDRRPIPGFRTGNWLAVNWEFGLRNGKTAARCAVSPLLSPKFVWTDPLPRYWPGTSHSPIQNRPLGPASFVRFFDGFAFKDEVVMNCGGPHTVPLRYEENLFLYSSIENKGPRRASDGARAAAWHKNNPVRQRPAIIPGIGPTNRHSDCSNG